MMIGMQRSILLSLIFLISSVVDGFRATKTAARRPFALSRLAMNSATTEPQQRGHVSFDPAYKGVDMARAHDCAEHFGKCSVEEMQELRDSYVP
jgi:hypothetical protein